MPDHIRFILRHTAVGFGLAVGFVVLLLAFDIAGLWHLVTHTAEGPFAVVVMTILFGITFGSAQVGYKIMTLDKDDDDDSGGKRDAVFTREAMPVRVSAHDGPVRQRTQR